MYEVVNVWDLVWCFVFYSVGNCFDMGWCGVVVIVDYVDEVCGGEFFDEVCYVFWVFVIFVKFIW